MKDVFTLERKVKIPADRHISLNWDFEVPESVPFGEINVYLMLPVPENNNSKINAASNLARLFESAGTDPLLQIWGSCKGEDTLDAYFERAHKNKLLEDEIERRSIKAQKA